MTIKGLQVLLSTAATICLLEGSAVAAENVAISAQNEQPAAGAVSTDQHDDVVVAQAGPQRPFLHLGTEAVTVSARRVDEDVQKVPVPISVVSGDTIASTGAYNLNRLTQQQPSLQFFSQNPRNTSVNIRGIGAPLGLTNDGIEQGVGVYVDQVYYNRVAATTLDFVDVEQIEVLRGPQGTLYGKNTTAGAINITTRGPSFDGFEVRGEIIRRQLPVQAGQGLDLRPDHRRPGLPPQRSRTPRAAARSTTSPRRASSTARTIWACAASCSGTPRRT